VQELEECILRFPAARHRATSPKFLKKSRNIRTFAIDSAVDFIPSIQF